MNKKLLFGTFLALSIAILMVQTASACEPCFCFQKNIVCGSTNVPMGQDYHWVLEIRVHSDNGMNDAVVTDRFGAEIEIDEPFPVSITHGTVSYTTSGKSAKVFLTWNIGDLEPGETATLTLEISTDLNPAGKQEYTTSSICGCPETYYELNSGAVLKFTFEGKRYSAYTDPILIFAYAVD